MLKIGAITIGQSPRTDLIPEMEENFYDDIEIIQMGGLDGLTREDIEKFTPKPNDYVLVSRLRDGSSVTFGESHVLPRLQQCIDKLEEQGVSLILFLCTGEFPEEFSASVPLLFLNRILISMVSGTMSGCRMTVLTPSADQCSQVKKKWEAVAQAVTVISVSPYDGLEPVIQAAGAICADETDVIVLDCIGYTVEMKRKIHDMTGKPVILPRTLVARVINELV